MHPCTWLAATQICSPVGTTGGTQHHHRCNPASFLHRCCPHRHAHHHSHHFSHCIQVSTRHSMQYTSFRSVTTILIVQFNTLSSSRSNATHATQFTRASTLYSVHKNQYNSFNSVNYIQLMQFLDSNRLSQHISFTAFKSVHVIQSSTIHSAP